MSLFDSSQPGITVLADVPFPATIYSGPGIEISKADPTAWSIALDIADLPEEVAPTPTTNYYIPMLDIGDGLTEKLRLDHLVSTLQQIDQRTGIGDVSYTVLASDRYVALTATLTSIRTLTLPAANTVTAGHAITFQDEVGGISRLSYWTIAPSGSDTIDGRNAARPLTRPRGGLTLWCDGLSKWSLARLTDMLSPTGSISISPDDTSIGFGTLTTPVTATLPLAANVSAGKTITVLDRQGSCTATNTITVARSGSDLINGLPAPINATLNVNYAYIILQSDGVSEWTIVGGGTNPASTTITSSQISDSTAIGRALITTPSTGAAQATLGAGTTGSQVFIATTPAAAQTALGLGGMATQAPSNINVTGGTMTGVQLNVDTITGGSIDNTPIGVTTPAAGHFTNLSGTAISGTTETLTGALQAGSIDNTPIGQTTPAAGAFTALKATSLNGGPFAGQRNRFINGAFSIDQRWGHSGAGGNFAGASWVGDHWQLAANVAGVFNYACLALGASYSPVSQYAGSVSVATVHAPAAGDWLLLLQRLEGVSMQDWLWGTAAAKPVTLSFYIDASTVGVYTLTVTNPVSPYRTYPTTFTVPTAGIWVPITITIPGDTSGGTTSWPIDTSAGLQVIWGLGAGSSSVTSTYNTWSSQTANLGYQAASALVPCNISGWSLSLTGVQLEVGSIATAFEQRHFGTEYNLCQRYYQRFTGAASSIIFSGYGNAGGNSYVGVPISPPMRSNPTCNFLGSWTNTSNVSSFNFSSSLPNMMIVSAIIGAAGYWYVASPANGGYELVAEL